ncbi:Non-hem dioxygenase N-terminal domain [Dillenia turbinata]|uniref:Non-hem dioxygenase N-terminal domain n=1 Tax=Dillenia turbinata TaxID=194707 RepID=A0AAN8UWJ8_9MAGN
MLFAQSLCVPVLVMASSATTKAILSEKKFEPVSQNERTKGVKYLVDGTPNLVSLPLLYALPSPKCPKPATDASIPVIDLSGLNGSDDQKRSLTIKEIGSACEEWGFFQVKNHGVKISLMEEMVKAVEEFFNLPLEEKNKYASNDVMDPVRYGTGLNTPAKHTPACCKEILGGGAISESLGLSKDYIERSLGQGCQIVANNYYPPCPEPDRTLGISPHSDHGGLTILMQNDVDGLQIKHGEDWVAVRYVPSTFVVNLGDYLEILSNGKYKSVEHRGVVNKEKTRISIAVGHGPELTATVAPAPPLISDNRAQFKPIMYKDYMKIQQSSVVRGKTPLEAILINGDDISLLSKISCSR